MTAAGIIAEYDPFHNGHKRHIERTRERTGCDAVIVAMNGSFSQRGEPMLLDKWTRARMALLGGADIVVELPAVWGVRPAEQFALGGVETLAATGCVQWLSFGCETEDVPTLQRLADTLEAEPGEYREQLRRSLAEGKSFARARGDALQAMGFAEELLHAPNAALAVEYLRANSRLAAPMRPVAVLRSVSHHAAELSEETSASAIRQAIEAGRVGEALCAVPAETWAILQAAVPGLLPDRKAWDRLLLYALRTMGEDRLRRLPDIAEGMDRAILHAAESSLSREELIAGVKSRRYTYARLSRILAHALLQTDGAALAAIAHPRYVRVLGFRRSAAPLLAQMRRRSTLPCIDRPVRLAGDPCFAFEQRATDVRALLSRSPAGRRASQDLTTPLVIVDA